MSEVKAWVWPDVSNRRQIHFAILEGYIAAIVAAAIALLGALIGHLMSLQSDTSSILIEGLYISLYLGLAFGIQRRSRAAATIALSIYVLNFLLVAIQHGPRGLIYSILITVALMNAVRATFAHKRLPVPPPGTPTLEESFAAFRKVPIPKDTNPQ